MLRYAITNRNQYDGTPTYRLDSLVRQAALWAAEGVEFIQLREKDLEAGEQVALARRVMAAVREVQGDVPAGTRVLVSSRLDVAVAAGADGVHLTATPGELNAADVRQVFRNAGLSTPLVSVSCHRIEEVARACTMAVDGILFGPVFAKVVEGAKILPGVGLEELRRSCEAAGSTLVFALGGVTLEHAGECLAAGAAGIAGIRLYRSAP